MTTKSIRTTIADNILREAKKQRISINELASAVGRSQVYDVLGKRKGCTVDFLDKVAGFLFVPTFKLLKAVAR